MNILQDAEISVAINLFKREENRESITYGRDILKISQGCGGTLKDFTQKKKKNTATPEPGHLSLDRRKTSKKMRVII